VSDAAGCQGIGGGGGVAEQDGAGREAGARPPGDRRPAGGRRDRRRAVEPASQERLLGDPAGEGGLRAAAERAAVAERREQERAVGQRRDVELAAAPDEDLEPVGPRLTGGELEVPADADAPAAASACPGRTPEAQRAAHRRLDAVGADHQARPAECPADGEPDGPSLLDHRSVHRGPLEHADAGGRGRLREQHGVEPEPALGQHGERAPVPRREPALGGDAEAVIADAGERPAPDRGAQAEALEHRDARGHDPLAAGLVAREAARLVELDRQPRAPEQDGGGGPGRAPPGDYDVSHGRKRGLAANARR
jgi:hypothetical protein